MSDKILNIFNKFCDKIKEIYFTNKTITDIVNKVVELQDSEKYILIQNMYDKFTKVHNGYQLLNSKKMKLFSSKEEETYKLSCSLFGDDLTLKKILNNLEGKDRDYIWISLKVLIEYSKPVDTKKTKNHILNVEVDENVNIMIDDIVKEFKNTMKNNKDNSNPMEAIFGITSKITEKYQDKLQSGEIKLDGLINDLQKNMPGVKGMMEKLMPKNKPTQKKEKIIIDENFSTENVTTGIDKQEDNNLDISKFLPMINGLGSGDIGSLGKELLGTDFGDMMNMIQNMDDIEKIDPEKLKDMKSKMDKMMKEKFNIDLKDLEHIPNNKEHI